MSGSWGNVPPYVIDEPFAYSHCTTKPSPQYRACVVPARAAYSHSASVGRRNVRPSFAEYQRTYASTSWRFTHTTGSRSVCAKPGLRQLAIEIFFHLKPSQTLHPMET